MRLSSALHEGVQPRWGNKALRGSAVVSFADEHDNISKKLKHEHGLIITRRVIPHVSNGGDQEDGFPRLRIISCAVHVLNSYSFPEGRKQLQDPCSWGTASARFSWLKTQTMPTKTPNTPCSWEGT